MAEQERKSAAARVVDTMCSHCAVCAAVRKGVRKIMGKSGAAPSPPDACCGPSGDSAAGGSAGE